MVSRDDVIFAYRLLLGREPENEAAIQGHLSALDWRELRERFIRSTEFQSAMGPHVVFHEQYDNLMALPAHVDVKISEEHFNAMLRHIQCAWEMLGVEKPHWSVITAPIFQPNQIDSNLSAFYESGKQSYLALERAAARAGLSLSNDWSVFELGCGVGRVTAQLAKRFRSVIACDVSAPHIELAREHLASIAIENVSLSVVTNLRQLTEIEPFDLFYSIIVLQHNPPPLIHRILQIVFEKVKLGGCVYFQLPVATRGYEFLIDQYLSDISLGKPIMETHILPQKWLFSLLRESRLSLLDIQRDTWQSSPLVSLSLLAQKLD
jgi:SAM-dependent methyltransferase